MGSGGCSIQLGGVRGGGERQALLPERDQLAIPVVGWVARPTGYRAHLRNMRMN